MEVTTPNGLGFNVTKTQDIALNAKLGWVEGPVHIQVLWLY